MCAQAVTPRGPLRLSPKELALCQVSRLPINDAVMKLWTRAGSPDLREVSRASGVSEEKISALILGSDVRPSWETVLAVLGGLGAALDASLLMLWGKQCERQRANQDQLGGHGG